MRKMFSIPFYSQGGRESERSSAFQSGSKPEYEPKPWDWEAHVLYTIFQIKLEFFQHKTSAMTYIRARQSKYVLWHWWLYCINTCNTQKGKALEKNQLLNRVLVRSLQINVDGWDKNNSYSFSYPNSNKNYKCKF